MENPPPRSFYKRRLPQPLVELASAEGKKRFTSALQNRYAEAFFPLVSQLQTQAHPAFCALTTLSTILNALQVDPNRVWAHPWRWFAESLLACCLDMEDVKKEGITMNQLAGIARCQGIDAHIFRRLNVNQATTLIKRSVQGNPDGSFEFLAASYDRKSLGQTGTGHFSPIAAYDPHTESVLVLDVARFKYSPHWVPIEDLTTATLPLDPSTGLPRGFMTFGKVEDQKAANAYCNPQNCTETCRNSVEVQ